MTYTLYLVCLLLFSNPITYPSLLCLPFFFFLKITSLYSLVAQLVKNLPAMQETIPGLGSFPREGNGYAILYFGLENSMDCVVHGVAKSRIRLSTPSYLGIFVCVLSPA